MMRVGGERRGDCETEWYSAAVHGRVGLFVKLRRAWWAAADGRLCRRPSCLSPPLIHPPSPARPRHQRSSSARCAQRPRTNRRHHSFTHSANSSAGHHTAPDPSSGIQFLDTQHLRTLATVILPDAQDASEPSKHSSAHPHTCRARGGRQRRAVCRVRPALRLLSLFVLPPSVCGPRFLVPICTCIVRRRFRAFPRT
ncbi:hypothetical protein BV20DRAFT_157254 [Pilatotrama ljubarskyi]|nr:hypothetical protein BV20DRAFT_157254 [Pilatotrama ljubarskyi]